MRVAVIGGGLTGLTATLKLCQKKHQVTIFEKENYLGGLAGTFKQNNWQWPLEFFYHHLFTSDKEVQNLLNNLGLGKKLFFKQPKTSIFGQEKIYRFDSPLSLLKFPHLNLFDKLRAGLVTLFLKFIPNLASFEKIKAAGWLSKNYGSKVYKLLWEPLLKAKFGKDYKDIALSWFWTRIKKRSQSLGYLQGSLQILTDKLVNEIKKQKGEIKTNNEIKNLDQLKGFEKIIFTIPTDSFLKITKRELPLAEQKKLATLKMSGTANLIMVLKKSFLTDGTYWLNINENNFPFVAVVQHTNFIDKKHYDQKEILYVGGYYSQDHPYFKISKEKILAQFLPYLKKINPNFKKTDILNYHLFANPNAQPTRTINYIDRLPAIKTPLKNVFLANMQQIYPQDRGVNYAVQLGLKVADVVSQS